MDRFLAKLVPTQWPQTFVIVPIDTSAYPDHTLPGDLPGGGGGGGGGHPAFPIWGPPGFGPGAGFPDKPGYPTIPGSGGGGGGGGSGPGMPVTIAPLPPSMPPPPVPAGLPPASVPVLVFYPGERYPALAWVQPSPSSGPVTPPEGTAAPAPKK